MTELVDGALASELDGLLTRSVNRRRGVRHGLLAVADVGGSWSWQGADGVAAPDGTPVAVDTRYLVASVTKLFTVEHLLSHTSGLPDYHSEAPRGGRSPQARLLAGEDAPVPFDEVLRLVREELTPHFPPQPFDASKRRASTRTQTSSCWVLSWKR